MSKGGGLAWIQMILEAEFWFCAISCSQRACDFAKKRKDDLNRFLKIFVVRICDDESPFPDSASDDEMMCVTVTSNDAKQFPHGRLQWSLCVHCAVE